MAVVHLQNDESQQLPPTILNLFPVQEQEQNQQVLALITDFFDWLETVWRFPILTPDMVRKPLSLPAEFTEEAYTIPNLVHICGYSSKYLAHFFREHDIRPLKCDKEGHSATYRKQDLTPLLEQWNWKQLTQEVDHWWLRFFAPACGICQHCQRAQRFPVTRQIYCARNSLLADLRLAFTHFLKEVSHLGNISAWWDKHHADTWEKPMRSAMGIILIYLLDRRRLDLSHDELLQLGPVWNKHHQGLTRLWRHRRPEEYAQFLHAMNAASYSNIDLQRETLTVLSLFVLLKYGLPGIAELGRALSPEELQQVCHEHRLVTMHLCGGLFLPYPLNSDIRIGHIVLDDIRHYFWRHAASQVQTQGEQQWHRKHRWYLGPHHWSPMLVNIIEQALAAPVYESGTGIISRRPETERPMRNPWCMTHKEKLTHTGYTFLPSAVQEHLMTYLSYCHQELRIELTTLRTRLRELVSFFTWVQTQGKLTHYPHWTRESAHEIFRTYATVGCAEMQDNSQRRRLNALTHFFSTLADLECPVPAGYRLLSTLEKDDVWHPRLVPHEEIMDRVFRDGVCRLAYDPFTRLALTIQYYCGTRVTETCDLHLFCILEDRNGHAYLLIPKGKSKEERPFPIVELGMGPLLTYMDEVVALRLSTDGTARTLGKTNFRYLDDDPERARDWHYLFDRAPSADGRVKKRGRLSKARAGEALQEALLLAAKINPDGLFQQETYSGVCQRQRRKGQSCHYFATQEGITTCPCCGSSLSGRLGTRCHHILEEDFVCDGVTQNGEAFCPKCDMPLASFLPITTHVFRHNSVSRAHRAGVSLAHNMRLHGHKTVPMHLRYLHLLLEDTTDEVRHIFAEKRLRDVRQILGSTAGKIVEGGIAYTVSLEQYLGLTLQRALKRRTYGIWGGFWAGALAQRGIASPLSVEDEIVIPEDTYEHTVAQYWYEALGLAVSEVAFEHVTGGKWHAEVPSFLDRSKIETLVQFHLHHIQDSFKSTLGQRLMETDILEQRRFLDDLAEKLRPWWQHLGTIDQLVEMFAPGGGHAFQKQLPPTEPAS